MFWADWGESPKLERAGMDGDESTRSLLVSGGDIYWPNSLTIDFDAGRVYWTDVKLRSIQSVRLDGTDYRRVAVFGSGVGSQSPPSLSLHPSSMTIVDDLIYWSDWQAPAIYATAKEATPGDGRPQTTTTAAATSFRVVASNIRASMDIRAYEGQRQPRSEFEKLFSIVHVNRCILLEVLWGGGVLELMRLHSSMSCNSTR
jgi:low density lipoprotein receptor-related protein 5/6